MKTKVYAISLGLLAFAGTGAAIAEDPTVNRLLASQCAQCHGTDGYAVGDMDRLHGEGFREIYEEMVEVRLEGRPGDIMDHQALGYTDDQARRIAAYFDSLSTNERAEEGREDEED